MSEQEMNKMYQMFSEKVESLIKVMSEKHSKQDKWTNSLNTNFQLMHQKMETLHNDMTDIKVALKNEYVTKEELRLTLDSLRQEVRDNKVEVATYKRLLWGALITAIVSIGFAIINKILT